MKKVLSFALVLALVLGSFAMVFAADFSDVKAGDQFNEAVNVLTALEIVSGYPDGTYKPGKVVKRSEMAALIINALNLPVSGKSQTRFSDVNETHWASGFIEFAASMNIISGYPDGTFKPDQEVSYDQALTMIVNALGYTKDALVGTWPGAYVNKALGLGILETCKKTGSTGANRGDIACFLYDALDCPIGKTDKDGNFVASVPVDTFAKRNGAAAYNAGNPFVVKGNEDATINMKDYLGAYVTATEKDGKIIVINEVLSEFVSGKIDAVERTLGSYKLDSALSLLTAVETFKNGAWVAKLAPTPAMPRTYAVKISGNYVKAIYSESEWTLVGGKQVVVTANHIAQISAKIPKFVDVKFPVDDNDAIDRSKFALLGVNSLADIKTNQVAYVYADAAGFIARIEIGTQLVAGEVTKVSSDNKDITIGGKVYNIAEGATANGLLAKNPGTKGVFRLDYYGDIFDAVIEEAGSAIEYYGMLLQVGKTISGDGLTEGRSVKLFLSDGTTKTFVADLTEVDALLGLTANFPKKSAGGVYPVTYQLNSKGEISKITKLALIGPMGHADVSEAGLYSGKIVTEDTVIVNIGTGAFDPSDASKYTILSRAEILGKTAQNGSKFQANAEDATKLDFFLFISDDLSTTTKTFGKVVGYEKLPGGNSNVFTLANGSAVTYASEIAYATLDGYKTDPLCELIITNGKLTSANVLPLAWNLPMGATASTVTGNFFVDNHGGGIVYTLSSDVKVYINDNGDWSVGTVSDLVGLTSGDVKLYDAVTPGDDVFEIVVYDKP